MGLGELLLRLLALIAAVLCVEAIGDERYLVALGLGVLALVLSGAPHALYKYLRGRGW